MIVKKVDYALSDVENFTPFHRTNTHSNILPYLPPLLPLCLSLTQTHTDTHTHTRTQVRKKTLIHKTKKSISQDLLHPLSLHCTHTLPHTHTHTHTHK